MGKIKMIDMILGQIQTNCYLIYHEESKKGVLVDPADHPLEILERCKKMEIELTAVLLTHGHFDHIGAVSGILEQQQVPVYAGQDEKELLANPKLNLSASFGNPIFLEQLTFLADGQIVQLLGENVKVIHTPGHTQGSVCYYWASEQLLFAGDTLFREAYGRTDVPTGNEDRLVDSILHKLFLLPDETKVYPGHGGGTTIGYEKTNNPLASWHE